MSMSTRLRQATASPCSFTSNRSVRWRLGAILLCWLLLAVLPSMAEAAERGRGARSFPLEMDALMGALTDVHQPAAPCSGQFPRTVDYRYLAYDIARDSLTEEKRSVRIPHRPERIIPHSIGITEILWAICPRDRIIAVHKSCKDRQFSFIAGILPDKLPTYGTEDAEIIIGYRPDLVLTTFYSDENFLHQIERAGVPNVQLGFFGDLASIEEQILLIGRLIGEERSAGRLTDIMNEKIKAIRAWVAARRGDHPLTVLYYDNLGYVAGQNSTFDSMCQMLGVTNIAAAKGIRYFKQIDYETLLQWNPDMIIVPEESTFDEQLYNEKILASAKAVREKNIRKIPSVYLLSASQYLVASTNYLAGLLYEK
jgi:iron complex transport system substrate-binding protein